MRLSVAAASSARVTSHGVFARRKSAREQQVDRVDQRRFLDHRAVEREQQCAFAHLPRARPRGQNRVEQREEHQHEDQDHTVLDPNQQLPDFAGKTH
jgi:hypothetical protein